MSAPKIATSRRGFLLAVPAAAAASATSATAACLVTDGDILGPFYRSGAKIAVKMAGAGVEGEQIALAGTVLHPDCKTPVAGAMIDFWHCDHKGAYDVNTPDEKIAPENFQFRAMAQSDNQGRFSFETIVPGRYAIPPGLQGLEKFAGQTRPAHFHMTIIHPLYLPLTTQLYFKGDPFIIKDPWAKHSRNMIVIKKGKDGSTGSVQIVLANRPGQNRSS